MSYIMKFNFKFKYTLIYDLLSIKRDFFIAANNIVFKFGKDIVNTKFTNFLLNTHYISEFFSK